MEDHTETADANISDEDIALVTEALREILDEEFPDALSTITVSDGEIRDCSCFCARKIDGGPRVS